MGLQKKTWIARTKNGAPRSIVFSLRRARARVSLSCESALPCPGRRCVCANVPLVSDGAQCHIPALPACRSTPGSSTLHVVLRALAQSAQAEQDALILYSCEESVVLGRSVAYSRHAVIGHRDSLSPRRFGTSESRVIRAYLTAGVGRSWFVGIAPLGARVR